MKNKEINRLRINSDLEIKIMKGQIMKEAVEGILVFLGGVVMLGFFVGFLKGVLS